MKLDLWSELEKYRGELTYHSKDSDSTAVVKWLNEFEIDLPKEEIPTFLKSVLNVSSSGSGIQVAPTFLLDTIKNLLVEDYSEVESICDPFARVGSVVLPIWEFTKPTATFAFTNMEVEAYIGKTLSKNNNIHWQFGDPLQLIEKLEHELDIICSVPPFRLKTNKAIELSTKTNGIISLKGDLGNQIIALACQKLKPNGMGIFVVPSSFFWSNRSIYQHFNSLGFSVNAALALPPGAFAPYANIETYLVVIKKQVNKKMFVAQLSYDLITNNKIVSNFNNEIVGESLELGRIIETTSFKSLNTIRIKEKIEKAKTDFKGVPLMLNDVATSFNLGRPDNHFIFQDYPNTVYIPLIGNSDVVEALDDPKLKKHNYAQVVIDPKKSHSRFIAHFYNSELGKEIRELSKVGTTISKLNQKTLKDLYLLLPDIEVQNEVLKVQDLIITEKRLLMGVQNELSAIERSLWVKPIMSKEAQERIQSISIQKAKAVKKAKEQMDLWIETLPFPLASILRSWYTTSNNDFKTKYEYLLYFFEATTQFISIILLSAFKESDNLYYEHENRLKDALTKSNLNLKRPTFGTWKFITDYFAKQTRRFLSGSEQQKAICSDIFSDPSLKLPDILSNKDLMGILEETNKMRNIWKGHGGIVGQKDAKIRNERLQLELNNIRELFADVWEDINLIMPLNIHPRRGSFENEVAILIGSNSNFNKDIWKMSTWLDIDSLYLHKADHTKSLKLIPFIQMGASPESVKNACYFYNRLEKEGVKFISYHHAEEAEIISPLDNLSEFENLLSSQ